MENEAPPRRSVAELAGRFKGPAPQANSTAGNPEDKPVRRRPPRTLQLPGPPADQTQPPSGVSSPPKAKRNSALIEKLQANLTLGSPTAAPLKSPGLRMLPLGFTPPSPGSAPPVPMVTTSSSGTPTSPAPTSPSTESPTSFEAPPSAAEGNILQSINKGRARVSIRRRPPSRRHRKSSSGDDAGQEVAQTQPSSRAEGEESAAGGGGEGEETEVFKKEGPTETSTPPEAKETHEEDETKSSVEEREKEEEEGTSSSQQREDEEEKKMEEEKTSEEEQKDPTDETTKEEEKMEGNKALLSEALLA
ncbi:LOW QUALITY PROTEIN: duboraya [Anableps anableps]